MMLASFLSYRAKLPTICVNWDPLFLTCCFFQFKMKTQILFILTLAVVCQCQVPWRRDSALLMDLFPSMAKEREQRCATCEEMKAETNVIQPISVKCGTVRAVQNRIVGGKEASRGQFPWQAQLMLKHDGRYRLACGGTLISHEIVLTAAHCIRNAEPSDYRVLLGKHKSSDPTDICTELKFQVVKILKHPSYSSKTLHNDIAILWIKSSYGQPVHFTDYIQPACLPSPDNDMVYEDGLIGTISGWGFLEEKGTEQSETLQYVKVPITNFRQCRNAYAKMIGLDEKLQFCASGQKNRQDACSGDSGGPFTVNKGGQNFLVGIVSFGLGCARETHPGIYTKLMHYIPWILRNIASQEEQSFVTQTITTTTQKTTTTIRTTTTRRTTTTMPTTTTRKPTSKTTRAVEMPQDGYDPGDFLTTPRPATTKAFGPICRGQFALLRCPRKKRIVIQEAFYGNDAETRRCSSSRFRRSVDVSTLLRGAALTTCSLDEATQAVAKKCNKRTSCWIHHRLFKSFSDPCSGKSKHIMIYYECR